MNFNQPILVNVKMSTAVTRNEFWSRCDFLKRSTTEDISVKKMRDTFTVNWNEGRRFEQERSSPPRPHPCTLRAWRLEICAVIVLLLPPQRSQKREDGKTKRRTNRKERRPCLRAALCDLSFDSGLVGRGCVQPLTLSCSSAAAPPSGDRPEIELISQMNE